MANKIDSHRPSRRAVLGMATGAGTAAALLAPGALRTATAQNQTQGKLPIGMNLAGIADWEPGFPFLNLMWGARVWMTRNASGQSPWNTEMAGHLELDDDGYPLEVPFHPAAASQPQQVFTLLPSILKPGLYVVLYDGDGEIGVMANTSIMRARPGRIEITMAHLGQDKLEAIVIRRSRRGNHVRNIRILPIEHERADLATNPFRPELLDFCRPWHCLRFMDWQQTNGSIESRWATRKRRSFYTQVGTTGDMLGLYAPPPPAWEREWGSGVSIELCVQLANLTKTDAWICVPHLADDDYIAAMARLVKEQLDPQLNVYVEFSNEIWNWGFHQAQWMIRSELAGDLVVESGGKTPWREGRKPATFKNGIAGDGGAHPGTDHPERMGALFRRCFRMWEEVFQGLDRKRLVRVCAVQFVWTDTIQRTLQWTTKHGGCDVLATGSYFGPDEATYKRWDAKGAALTSDDVIADMRPMIESHAKTLQVNVAIARRAGVRLVAYEGGQHIEPQGHQDRPYNRALGDAQKHPAMYDLYRLHLDRYASAGCHLFCAFNSVGRQGTRHGSWGHIERYGQDPKAMPKYRAILDANTPLPPRR